MRALVTGAGGQLGRTVAWALAAEHDVAPLTRADLDVTDESRVRAAVADLGPGVRGPGRVAEPCRRRRRGHAGAGPDGGAARVVPLRRVGSRHLARGGGGAGGGAMREDYQRLDDRMRTVEQGLVKIDQRLATLERVAIPAAEPAE